MRTLLAKEIAEHGRWAGLAALALALLLIGFHHFGDGDGASPAFSIEVHLSACWFALAWAVTLALLQFLRDARDEWQGLLVHRNASRDAIAWSKLLAGMALLAISLGIPLLIAGLCWLMPVPDERPFFFIDLTHLALAMASVALTGYAAGAAIASRSSRWWTTRCLPAFIPIAVIIPSWIDVMFSCLAALALTPVLLVATIAWQRAGGRDSQLGWGGVVAWSLCALLPLSALVLVQAHEDQKDKGGYRQHFYYSLQHDGSIQVIHDEPDGKHWMTTLDGALLDPATPSSTASSWLAIPDPHEQERLTWLERWQQRRYWFDPPMYDGFCQSNPRMRIYFSSTKAAMVAADRATGRMLGFVTSTGLAPAPLERLRLFSLGSTVTCDDDHRRIYVLEADAARLRHLFTLDEHELFGAALMDASERFYWITTSRRLLRVATDGTLLAGYPLRPEFQGSGIGLAGDGAHGRWDGEITKGNYLTGLRAYQFTVNDPGGRITVRELPGISVEHAPSTADAGAVAVLEAPALAIIQSHGVAAPALSIVGTLLAAASALWLGKRCALRPLERLLWCLAILTLGALPLVPLIALRGGVVREPCPACGRLRMVTRARCEHCSAPFPAPARSPYAIRDADAPAPASAMLAR